jgi:transposase
MDQNAGENGLTPAAPGDPPRRRANQVRGHGPWDHDRPPMVGVVGRESGEIRLAVCHHRDRQTLHPVVEDHTTDTATVYTAAWQAYNQLPHTGRSHARVSHTPGHREGARDDDGEGRREVHGHTLEGLWTGLRNFLRPFRGVNTQSLGQYPAVFQAGHHLKEITPTL